MGCCCCLNPFKFFEPDDPMRATTSRFLPRCGFIFYKMLCSCYFVFWSIYFPVADDVDDAYLFVTYWTFYITAIYFLVSTITSCMVIGQQNNPRVAADPVAGTHGGHQLSGFARFLLGFQMFTWNVACVGSIVVVIVFWVSLYEGGALTATDVNAHAIIAGIMVLDQMLVASMFERWQMRATLAYSITYIAFNIVWFLVGTDSEKVIYKTMDWGDDLGSAILFTVIIIFVLVPVCGLVHYGVYRLREYIFASCGNGEPHLETDVESGKRVVLSAS